MWFLFRMDSKVCLRFSPRLPTPESASWPNSWAKISTPSSAPGLVANEFALLPPVGILPAYTMDFVNKVALWCPSNWTVTAAPLYTEEIEGALQSAITAAPLDTTRNETIEILVPLPDEVYDPNILVTEVVASIFQQEVDAATDVRNGILRHRKVIELEANALATAISQPLIDISAGLTADEIGPHATVPRSIRLIATRPSRPRSATALMSRPICSRYSPLRTLLLML